MKKTFLGLACAVLIAIACVSLAETVEVADANILADDAIQTTLEDRVDSALCAQELSYFGQTSHDLLRGTVASLTPCIRQCRQDFVDCREDGYPQSVCSAALQACRASCN